MFSLNLPPPQKKNAKQDLNLAPRSDEAHFVILMLSRIWLLSSPIPHFQIYCPVVCFSVLESSLKHITQRLETSDVGETLPIGKMITRWWMPLEIIFIVNGIVVLPVEPFGYHRCFSWFFPLFSFGNHEGVGAYCILIQALPFFLF